MTELSCAVPTPKTPRELEQAIQIYRTSDLSSYDLFCQWQAIRDAALQQMLPEPEGDRVPGEDSY